MAKKIQPPMLTVQNLTCAKSLNSNLQDLTSAKLLNNFPAFTVLTWEEDPRAVQTWG